MPSFTVFKGQKGGKVYKTETHRPDLQGDQVLVRVTASGLCGTDLHYREADMVLGHEGVGIVEETGPGVARLKKGARVGWGYEHYACLHCQQCLQGAETFCQERQMYGVADLDQGSNGTHAVWREAFLFNIPDDMSDEIAAPLMCGGTTVFNALHSYGVKPTETVGIMGIGGLGHLAVQFAAKMGCYVVVISGSDSKKEEAFKLGAHEFVTTKNEIKPSRKLDRLLVTASVQPEWEKIIPALGPRATIHPLSADRGTFSIPYMAMLANGLTIQGSIVAPRYVQNRMLSFAAQHKIEPIIEKFPMTEEGINGAMDKLKEGKIRYRGVFLPQA